MVRALAAVGALTVCGFVGRAAEAAPSQFFYSSFSDEPKVFRSAIDRRPAPWPVPAGAVVRGGILTHHLLAASLMAVYFETVARSYTPSRFILLAPEHPGRNPKHIALSDRDWVTPFGILRDDRASVAELRRGLELHGTTDEDYFFGEHSVGALAPFVKAYFPDAEFLPILVSKGLSPLRASRLVDLLRPLIDARTHVLLSMDFCHERTPDEARCLDRVSESVIEAKCWAQTGSLEMDCTAGLSVLLRLLADEQVIRGLRSDSAEMSGRPQPTCTSYQTFFFVDSPEARRRLPRGALGGHEWGGVSRRS